MKGPFKVAALLAFAVFCGAAPPPRPPGIAILRRNLVEDRREYARNHIPDRFHVKGTILKSPDQKLNQKVHAAPFQRVPGILGINRNHIPNRFDIKGTPVGGPPQGQVYQPAPAVPDCCNPGGYGQYPAQAPAQYPPQTPPACCNTGGQYPPVPPPTGCCGAASAVPHRQPALLVPLRNRKGKKTGFIRIAQNGAIRKIPLPPKGPVAPPQVPPPAGQGAAPYGGPAQPYGYQGQVQGNPQTYGQQPYGAQPPVGTGYNPQSQGGFYPMGQQYDEAQQAAVQANSAPAQGAPFQDPLSGAALPQDAPPQGAPFQDPLSGGALPQAAPIQNAPLQYAPQQFQTQFQPQGSEAGQTQEIEGQAFEAKKRQGPPRRRPPTGRK